METTNGWSGSHWWLCSSWSSSHANGAAEHNDQWNERKAWNSRRNNAWREPLKKYERPWCRRCGCIYMFAGLTDECCFVTRGQPCKFEPATPSARDSCTCGFCCSEWMLRGWRCFHAGVPYMASGRRVNLYPGARSDLAESLGVPPGCLCRRATLILVAKTSGCLLSKI